MIRVTATSMWDKPVETDVESMAEAMRLKRELRDQQYHVEIEHIEEEKL